jgi:preprotein translocase subunit SecG
MQNVVLIVHLILALCLIGVVLLQRSEGGALGIGGGGGGLVSQRGAATALSKITWALAIGFLCTSILLTILAGGGGSGSVLDQFLTEPDTEVPLPELLAPGSASDPAGGDLLPPAETAPAVPPASE